MNGKIRRIARTFDMGVEQPTKAGEPVKLNGPHNKSGEFQAYESCQSCRWAKVVPGTSDQWECTEKVSPLFGTIVNENTSCQYWTPQRRYSFNSR